MQRVHVQPQHQRACAHGTRTPAGGAPRGPGRPWRVAAAPELPMPWARAVLWARRRGSSMCPDRLILYAKCAFRIWCALTCAFRICPTENHAGIPPGCALTCALKNRACGASVPARGVCLQVHYHGIFMLPPTRERNTAMLDSLCQIQIASADHERALE